MATIKALHVEQTGPARARPQDVDRYVGARMRGRRIMLHITQRQMAESIGITSQQVQKYETGENRIAAGRLYAIADALDVDVSYFFEGMGSECDFEPTPQQRMLLDLARNFNPLPSDEKVAICNLVRALASGEDLTENESPSTDAK